jgi:hypothetical protein
MELVLKSIVDPNVFLKVWNPPGHRKLLISIEGEQPNDGIPYEMFPDLMKMLTEFQQTMISELRPHTDHFEHAAQILGHKYNPAVEDFTPTILEPGYGIVVVGVEKCSHCHQPMTNFSVPTYLRINKEAQLKRAGWKAKSSVESDVDGGSICQECADAGVAKFTCALCKQARPYADEQERYGDPAEYLCIHCFKTVTAHDWEKALGEIYERHKWDYTG